jgi:HAD superfamily hydrolase (TIGR01549 family)
MYDGLLLDHDGVITTLVDGGSLRGAARTALRDAGVPDPDESAVRALAIHVDDADLLEVSRQYELDPDRLWRYRDERAYETLRDAVDAGRKVPYDDADALQEVERPMGIVSNNQARLVERALSAHELRELFGTIRARAPERESIGRKKPRPTYLEAAMDDLGVESPLYVGDSESDVIAGRRAGVDTAFVRRGHNGERALGTSPTYEVGGLDEVVELLDGAN